MARRTGSAIAALAVIEFGLIASAPPPLSSQERVPGYRIVEPIGWQRSPLSDGARFTRRASDSSTLVMQLRAPVSAVYTPTEVVEHLLDAIVAADGIHDPVGGPITTQTVERRPIAYVSRSYIDRTGAPVYLYLMAFWDGRSIGMLQVESRTSAAMNELRAEVSAFATSLRVDGRSTDTRIAASLLTTPENRPPAMTSASAEASATREPRVTTVPVALPTDVLPWPPMADGPRLSGVWTMFETGAMRVGVGVVQRLYVYWPDGRVLMTFPSGGVVHPGETRFTGIDDGYWGRYTVHGDSVLLTWNNGRGRQAYALSRVAMPNLDRATIRPAAAPVRNLRLRGTFDAPGYEGKRYITLDESGRFATGEIALPNTAGRGTYTIDGYAMLLAFDSGARERVSFVALEPGATPRTIALERMPLALRQ